FREKIQKLLHAETNLAQMFNRSRPQSLDRGRRTLENALVKQSWPTVAASPIPINRVKPSRSTGRVGGDTTGASPTEARIEPQPTADTCSLNCNPWVTKLFFQRFGQQSHNCKEN
ncbi:MAG TPA: hypothetical protein VM260_27185, partial [Pirellula sp.]|nr:hypothetical protein [Pirellula sp.]